MARRYRKELKKSDFWRFRGVEIHEIHDGGPESSNPRKTPRLEGGPHPDRPSRFQRASKFRDSYVLTRGTSIL